jgi:carbamoyl-phosphate synthase large subunit
LRTANIAVDEVPKLQEGRPNLIDHMKNHRIALVINTPSGRGARTDEGKIRAEAVANGVTCITTLAAAHAAVAACRALQRPEWSVSALQDRFPVNGNAVRRAVPAEQGSLP